MYKDFVHISVCRHRALEKVLGCIAEGVDSMKLSKEKLLRYNLELRYLAILFEKGLITEEERDIMYEKIKKDYGVVCNYEA